YPLGYKYALPINPSNSCFCSIMSNIHKFWKDGISTYFRSILASAVLADGLNSYVCENLGLTSSLVRLTLILYLAGSSNLNSKYLLVVGSDDLNGFPFLYSS